MFEIFGPLKRCGIHWNNLGLSKGTADIEYVFAQDASRAKQEYNRKSIPGRNIVVHWSNNNNNEKKKRERKELHLPCPNGGIVVSFVGEFGKIPAV